MSDETQGKGGGRPEVLYLMSIPQIAELYGVNVASVRQWKLTPAVVVPLGKGRTLKLFWRADVEAYANSTRRLNRLQKPDEGK